MNLTFEKGDKSIREFVYNEFVKNAYDYENIEQIDINEICKLERNKLTKHSKDYTKIMVDGNFMGAFYFYVDGDDYIMEDFYVVKGYRNQGIGSIALGKCIQKATEENKKIKIRIFKKNSGAIRFYQRFNFAISEDEENYYIMTYKGE